MGRKYLSIFEGGGPEGAAGGEILGGVGLVREVLNVVKAWSAKQ